jgi:hypothetical protein
MGTPPRSGSFAGMEQLRATNGDAGLGGYLIAERGAASVASDRIRRALHAVRSHLGMQVAYVSKFSGNQSIFREVDASGLEHLIKPGDSRSLDDVYCPHILEGRLPQLVPDTSAEPLAASTPMTSAIGAHVSVPVLLPDGQPYGLFCCIGQKANNSLNDPDCRQ